MSICIISRNLSEEAEDLYLYATNDAQIYSQRYLPIVKNLLKKLMKGIYDSKLAVKLFMYLVDDVSKKYAKELNQKPFNKKIRNEVAEEYLDNFEEKVKIGEFDIEDAAPIAFKRNPKALKELEKQMKSSIKNKRNIIEEINKKMKTSKKKAKGFLVNLYKEDKDLAIKTAKVLGMKIKVKADITPEQKTEYKNFAKSLKKNLEKNLKMKLSVKTSGSKRPNPSISVQVKDWRTETLPNDFRKKVAKILNIKPSNWENVQYGNINDKYITLNYNEWKKVVSKY